MSVPGVRGKHRDAEHIEGRHKRVGLSRVRSNAQLKVARALHDDDLLRQCLKRQPLPADLARLSAALTRKWALAGGAKEDLWAKYNDIDRAVALRLTGSEGPICAP